MAELALVDAPAVTWRVERATSDLRFSRIDVIDASGSTGNRFDVPGAGILYTATTKGGAFAETLARFRPTTGLIEKMRQVQGVDDADQHDTPGAVDDSWFDLRRLRAVQMVDPLPFVDVDDPRTHTFLTQHAARDLLGVGMSNLDVATLRGPDRRVTRAIASWLYARTNEDGTPQFSGLRYGSRLGAYECWAIFDGTTVDSVAEERIGEQPELGEVMETFGLTRSTSRHARLGRT